MRYILIFATLTVLLFPSTSFAAIIQGNSSATVNIQTNVEGQGSVTTHVVTDINGKTQTYDSTKSGSIHITATNNGTTVVASDNAHEASPAKQTKLPQQPTGKNAFLQTVFDNIKKFFTTVFHWL